MQNDWHINRLISLDLFKTPDLFHLMSPLKKKCVCNIDDRKQTTGSIRKISPHVERTGRIEPGSPSGIS
jgi:hypothetical protein